MSRALASLTRRVFFCRETSMAAPTARQIHNIRLVELHDTLHRVPEPSLRLQGFKLHSQSYKRSPIYESAFQTLQPCEKTGTQSLKMGPVYVQYGPLFEKANHKMVAVTETATSEVNTISETKPGGVIQSAAKKLVEISTKLPIL